MAESRLGVFVLQHRYRIVGGSFDEYLGLISVVRTWLIELGVASFEIWRSAEDSLSITEVQGYDSWSHYIRVNQQPVPPKVEEVYHDLERVLDGGFAQVITSTWDPQDVPDWDGAV